MLILLISITICLPNLHSSYSLNFFMPWGGGSYNPRSSNHTPTVLATPSNYTTYCPSEFGHETYSSKNTEFFKEAVHLCSNIPCCIALRCVAKTTPPEEHGRGLAGLALARAAANRYGVLRWTTVCPEGEQSVL